MNTSGLQPVEFKILIEPEDAEHKTPGGIVLPEKTTDREKQAQVRGKLIAVGGNAFIDWAEPIPKVGESVWFAKYAGFIVDGDDGIEYRLCHDKDVAAIVTKKEETNE